jgi:hypothetical protein
MTAVVGRTPGDQPLIVPSCVAKRKMDWPDFVTPPSVNETTKLVAVVLPITPVGVPWTVPLAEGIVTTRPCF